MTGAIESATDRYLSGEEATEERVEAYERYFCVVRRAQLADEMAKAVILGGNNPRTEHETGLVNSLALRLSSWVQGLYRDDIPSLANLAADYEVGLSWGEWCEPPEREYEKPEY